ncbi:DUF6461 domain-containing protein [Streptomyces pseudovenezuelae]|uniref:DUF402 domain-containing protein n=1 Tax=Streptomyces pseudovenezuelae TaxID=67350 RepID=A0ABT6LL44_9ACTN|nr:DUF6461 domain-containing protein [Streptomyces pseudovenezuelae]MDH6217013.1 hypothetical protein [Streptomyces pseudovenezuelae]
MTGRTPHARDYAWLRERHAGLRDAYCITLAGAIGPQELLAAVGAGPGTRITGVAGLFEPSFDCWERAAGAELFVGVAALGDWAVMVEVNGYLGVSSPAIRTVSAGRTVVSHYYADAMDRFLWLADGELLLRFEPLHPSRREGSGADRFLVEMRESGFRLDPDQELDLQGAEAAFALAERITGVRLTAELLDSLEFVGAVAPVP